MTARSVPLRAPEVECLFGSIVVEFGSFRAVLCDGTISCVQERQDL